MALPNRRPALALERRLMFCQHTGTPAPLRLLACLSSGCQLNKMVYLFILLVFLSFLLLLSLSLFPFVIFFFMSCAALLGKAL